MRAPAKKLFRLLAVLAFLCSSSSSLASTVFGPKMYTVTAGKPSTWTEDFDVDLSENCEGKVTWVLRLENGDSSRSAVSSGLIRFNGIAMIDEPEFRTGILRLDRPLHVAASNTLEVQIKSGGPDAFVKISIFREIEEPVLPERKYTSEPSLPSTDTFVLPDVSGPFLLTVFNGDERGENRVSSASIEINGETVVREGAVHQYVSGIRTAVNLQRENRISCTVRGGPHSFVNVVVRRLLDETACAPKVEIVVPSDGSHVTAAEVLVSGTVSGTGTDVGVTVNGAPAQMDLEHAGTVSDPIRWFVLLTPAAEGLLELEVVATDERGRHGHARSRVEFTKASRSVRLRALLQGGVAPHEALFEVRVDPWAPERKSYEFDLDGDGTFEMGPYTAEPEELTHTFSKPGLYRSQMRATFTDGSTQTTEAYVVVQSFAAVDTIVRKRWKGLLDALAAADVEGAVKLFAPDSRAKFEATFTKLKERLPEIAGKLSSSMRGSVEMTADRAHYLIIREENGEKLAHYVTFARGDDGTWVIVDM